MKLEILQENFNSALTLVCRILSAKPQLPILSHILLEAKNGKLTLTSSNQEITITTEIGAKIISDGAITIPGRTLLEIVSSLSAEKITLEVEESTVGLKAGGFKASINGTSAKEYPSLIPSVSPKEPSLTIPAKQFKDLISKTVFSCASDEGRAVLTGELFKLIDGRLTVATTDGFRLSVVQQEETVKDWKTSVVIPAKTMVEVEKILTDSKAGKVDIILLEETNQIYFNAGDIKIYSSLITGTFPDYEKIIPAKSLFKIVIEANELVKAVRLASVFARESANIVKFQTSNLPAGEAGFKLKISANAPEVGDNESEVDVKVEGEMTEEFSIAFNFHYLLDFLSAIGGSGEMTIELTSSTTPGVFKTTSDPNFLHLIMPVRVQ